MTYNELVNKISKLKPARASWRNVEKLRNLGLSGTWEFVGDDYKRYHVTVIASRGYIGLSSRHRRETLAKHCGNRVGHLIDII